MDVILGGGSGGLSSILTGKNSGLLALLPLLLNMLGSKSDSGSGGKTTSKPRGKTTSKPRGKTTTKSGGKTTTKSTSRSGLEDVLGGFSSGGLGDIVGSWIGGGPNKSITAAQVKQGLGPKQLAQLSKQSGMSTDEVAEGVATLLPELVNHLTPRGQVPEPSALDSALQSLAGLLPQ
jgi:uncharacterized protein YidB (DUF937 family)